MGRIAKKEERLTRLYEILGEHGAMDVFAIAPLLEIRRPQVHPILRVAMNEVGRVVRECKGRDCKGRPRFLYRLRNVEIDGVFEPAVKPSCEQESDVDSDEIFAPFEIVATCRVCSADKRFEVAKSSADLDEIYLSGFGCSGCGTYLKVADLVDAKHLRASFMAHYRSRSGVREGNRVSQSC